MKILGLVVLGLASLTVRAACPDLSGTFADKSRANMNLIFTQVACDSETVQIELKQPDGTDYLYPAKTYIADGVKRQYAVGGPLEQFQFNETGLVSRSFRVNAQGCDQYAETSLTAAADLQIRWRLECPNQNTEWKINLYPRVATP